MSTPVASSLSVPTTQNTAPVIKFRCLFTHDMRRKAKRWQDGYLRFHTFNKRAMVYDTTGNFVGDLHWRHEESIQDGDELELDRGVIIQVCEPMEKTETDLSALYAKKSSQGSPSRPAGPPTPSVRSSTPLRSSLSSQPSRSLNDLLGIKKTPIAHLVSPHEGRTPPRPQKVDQQVSQPAPKRQKTACSDSRPRESLPNASRPDHPEVIDLSDPLDTTEQDPASQHGPSHVGKPRKDPNPSRVKSSSLSTSAPKPRDTAETLGIERPQSATGNVSKASSRIPPDKPVNKLRLSNEKPRKKLMYSALLPTQASSKAPTTAAVSARTNGLAWGKSQNAPAPSADRIATNFDFTPSASTQFVLDEMIDDSVQSKTTTPSKSTSSGPSAPSPLLSAAVCHSAQAQGLPPSRSLTGLRKSYSDPTTLTSASFQRRTACSKSPLNQHNDDTNHEQGPWTTEALDLFDFWPPGRPKPG
ncbi:hypothetical protein P170DRAFT_347850 [Aspergillus steynii IBT 23096]|uniref:5'-3' DNA helicase ZGRF1-like N-terminal domain-containing protein n=1 Tax=Aspergillus steynii IBT 23096 TaxID=1392250 RepID=A0A2I2GL76_9EURO|nr:uncharacterized protein P170DRAFT_347850 [Aspergillus steynii IBT 23096]PLB53634.1 hypothetical protein P170DRAFT_347850 [Aspergillus steynii IBT 23096]